MEGLLSTGPTPSSFESISFNVNFGVVWVVERVEIWVQKQILRLSTEHKLIYVGKIFCMNWHSNVTLHGVN